MSTLKLENIKHENSSSNNLVLDSDGNVIIGTGSDIGSKLSVNSQASFGTDNNNRGIIDYSSNVLSMGTIQSGTANFSTVNVTGGNVGIGINSPVSKLVVKGVGGNGTVRVIPVSANAEASIGYYQDTAGANMTDRWVAGVGGWGQTNQFVIGNYNSPKLKIDTSGRTTIPYQPFFLVNNYGQVKANGWQYLDFTGVVDNVGNHYTTANSRFTAPVDGVYLFSTGGYIQADNSTERYGISFYVNGSGGLHIGGGTQADVDAPLGTVTQAIKLSASDYVQVRMFTPNAETLGASYHRMWFNGYLLG